MQSKLTTRMKQSSVIVGIAVAMVVETTKHAVQVHAACNEPSRDFVEHPNFAIPFQSSNAPLVLDEPNHSVV